jgi:hypothetical protein
MMQEITTNVRIRIAEQHVHSVHCAGLSHVHGLSQYVVSAYTVGALGKLNVIYSVLH